MRPNANIIKTYWQAMCKYGNVYMHEHRPKIMDGVYYVERGTCTDTFLFPIPLKPLQIAEIKVNENGTWSYEIEREEGWYMAKEDCSGRMFLANYKGGFWTNSSGVSIAVNLCTISSTRIPDECII